MKTYDIYPNNNKKRKPIHSFYFFFFIFLLLCSSVANATIFYVKPTATGTGDGSSWANASADLQGMIDVSAPNDEIWVAAGTYLPTKDPFGNASPTNPRDKTFYLKNQVKLYGGFAGTETLLSQRTTAVIAANPSILSGDINNTGTTADDVYHVVLSVEDDNTTVIDGFTITKGNAGGSTTIGVEGWNVYPSMGGGMYNRASTTVSNCIFTANAANSGGGLINFYYSPIISNCSFISNGAFVGGGMFNDHITATIQNCSFTNNTAGSGGGGMYNYAGTTNVTNCSFSSNFSSFEGGGIKNFGGTQTFSHCTFISNNGNYGGGVYNNYSESCTLTDCNFLNNSGNWGGGINNRLAMMNITNCNFYGNTVTERGGAIENYDNYNGASTNSVLITNTTFSNNTANQGGAVSNYYNVKSTFVNCSFSNNSASSNGGGVYNESDALPPNPGGNITRIYLKNSIFWGNKTGTNVNTVGADIENLANTLSQSLVTNTILQFANNTTNYPVSTSIGFLGAGTGNKYVIDPLFVNASDPDGIDNIFSTADDGLALQNCSPAINAGNNADNLAVTDITGATRIKNSRIDMGAYENGAVSVSLVVNPSGAFCFGTSRTFTATPTNGGTSPTYNFKVNGVSVQNNSSNIFTTTTLVNNDAVIVEMTSNLCSFTIPATSNSITMQVYALPTPTAGSNSPVCAVNTLNMTSSGGGTYAWTGPNRFSSTDQNLSFPNSTTSLSGTYIITVTNVNGCSATASTAVIVNALPISSAGNNSPICSGNTLNLTSSGGTSYAWTGPNNYSSSTQNPNFTNAISSLSGIYIVTVTNVTGCTATTLTTVTVNASPTPTAGSNSPICAGNTLNITSSGGGTYAWTGPNSFSSTTQNPGFNNSTVSLSGIYTVTITNTYGCTAAATTLVTVNLVPTLSAGIAINPTTVGGADGNIPFTTNLPNGTYSLSYIGTGSPKNIIVSAGIFTLNGLIAGVYSNFSITNNGCTGTDATSKTLNNPPIYVISIATGNWESSSTWDVGRIPQAGDTVIINTNHTVTLNGTGIAKNLEIRGIFRYNLVGSSLNLGL